MKKIQSIIDVYPAIDELIIELKTVSQFKLADTLYHRLHQVAWTSGSELFEELQNVLEGALQSYEVDLSESIRSQIQQILCVIKRK